MKKTDKYQSKVAIFIQARMRSKRFPNKMIADVNGKTLLEYIILGFEKLSGKYQIIIATGAEKFNKQIIKIARKNKIKWFSYKNEGDVLERFILASKKFKPDHIVRSCGDNPFFDIEETEFLIENHLKNKAGYSANTKSVPIFLAREIVSRKALENCVNIKTTRYQREHVGPAFIENEKNFKIQFVTNKKKWPKIPRNLNIDTKEDLIAVNDFLKNFNNKNIIFGEDIRKYYLK